MSRIVTIATLPPHLVKRWLQHLRDFDVTHKDCHFEVMVDAPEHVTMAEALDHMKIDPPLQVMRFFDKKGEAS